MTLKLNQPNQSYLKSSAETMILDWRGRVALMPNVLVQHLQCTKTERRDRIESLAGGALAQQSISAPTFTAGDVRAASLRTFKQVISLPLPSQAIISLPLNEI